jgi:CheY-like chemotaxis protein
MTAERSQVLVVDDDEDLRELLVRYLGDNGYAATGVVTVPR